MGLRRRPEVKFSHANLPAKRPAFVDDEIQGGLPSSLKRKYKTILFGCKSLFFPLVIQYK